MKLQTKKTGKKGKNPSTTLPTYKPSTFSIAFQSLAFKTFGGKARSLESALRYYLGIDISKSGMRITPEMYACLTVFSTLLAFIIPFAIGFFFLFFLLKMYWLISLIYCAGFSGFSSLITLMVFKFYPSSRANTRKVKLEAELPYALSYMAVMAKAGAIPEEIFKSLAEAEAARKSIIAEESRMLIRDVAVFGKDILSALAENARKAPSRDFADALWGVSSTIRTGGDLSEYLEAQARNAFAKRRIVIRRFIDNLALLGEFFISVFVAAPLIFVVLLIVMAILGGTMPLIAGLNTVMVLQLLTYVYLPFMAAFMVLLIDLIQPKEG